MRIRRVRPFAVAGHTPVSRNSRHPDAWCVTGPAGPGARAGVDDTTPPAPDRVRQAARLARLGRILDLAPQHLEGRHADADLAFLAGRAPGRRLPCLEVGPITRKVDEDGRLKLLFEAGTLVDLIGWKPGALETTVAEGWLLLRQQGETTDAPLHRFDERARMTRDRKGLERICLKPGHLRLLSLGPDRNVLVVALVGARCVALVNPSVCLLGSPPLIRQFLDPVPVAV